LYLNNRLSQKLKRILYLAPITEHVAPSSPQSASKMGKQIGGRKLTGLAFTCWRLERYKKMVNQKLHMWKKGSQTNGKSIMEANR